MARWVNRADGMTPEAMRRRLAEIEAEMPRARRKKRQTLRAYEKALFEEGLLEREREALWGALRRGEA
jgi:hypothetical protein